MKDIRFILDKLKETFGEKKREKPFRCLISTMLSQRTRDENTKRASERLFSVYSSAYQLSHTSIDEIEKLIRPAGMPKNKAKNIIKTAGILVEKYNGKVPDTLEELISLPGVGRKTANIVLERAFDKPAIAVDVHVHRISNRIGIVNTRNPYHTEKELERCIPKERWGDVNYLFVQFGRMICKPKNPRCDICPFFKMCDYGMKKTSSRDIDTRKK